jgi:thiosulfate/3-mercaptopyruvate sulfurtransferase
VSAGYVNPQFLIEPAELATRLESGSVRVFDGTVILEPAEKGYRARAAEADYQAGHIPGAAFINQMTQLSDTSSGLGFALPDAVQLQRSLGELGAGSGHSIVVYSSGHMMWATRLWWLLHYAGHDDVAVLNGGLDAWREAGLGLSTEAARYPAADFNAPVRERRFVDKTVVLNAINEGSVCTVNALAPGVYSGESSMSYGRKGHIPGSVNVYYDQLLEHGRFRPAAELRAHLDGAGLLQAPQVVAYCGGGISATIDAFACLLVGQDNVAVYDGSMSEWVRDESLPLTTGTEPG